MTWRGAAYRAVRPLLFTLDPERVHHSALGLLRSRIGQRLGPLVSGASSGDSAAVELFGLRFRNRVGLGAGFDKDGLAIAGWAALGFGFIELGTVTPRPQEGNPRPRLYRLPGDAALINRMGFNNAGAEALAGRIANAKPRLPDGFVVGVNIGRNRDGDVGDYPVVARTVREVADYLALNVSSPNTPGLRHLQAPDQVAGILAAVADAAPGLPVLVKLAPDLSDDERAELVARIGVSGAAGVIVSNTTVTRPGPNSRRLAAETGGLSGRPLLPLTTRAVAQSVDHGLAVVASGGIGSAADAAELRKVGADLVQLWTGMIYAGPGLIGDAITATAERSE